MSVDIGTWLDPVDTDSASRSERRRGRKINEIMMFTARVVSERGYHSTNIEEIAGLLDLSKASIYHYFNGKAALVLATLESCAEYVTAQLNEIATRDESATARLIALISRQLSIIAIENVEISRLFLQPLDWPPTIGVAVHDWQREHGRIFRGVISEGMASGEFGCPDARIANVVIQGTMNVFPQWFPKINRGEESVIDAFVDRLLLVVEATPIERVSSLSCT